MRDAQRHSAPADEDDHSKDGEHPRHRLGTGSLRRNATTLAPCADSHRSHLGSVSVEANRETRQSSLGRQAV